MHSILPDIQFSVEVFSLPVIIMSRVIDDSKVNITIHFHSPMLEVKMVIRGLDNPPSTSNSI
jgi:hypothetical protein